ncbi:hypothetical protein Aperf_G00000121792 [Anoplocephala perfoliata]
MEAGNVHGKYGTLHDFACHPCAGAMLISLYRSNFSICTSEEVRFASSPPQHLNPSLQSPIPNSLLLLSTLPFSASSSHLPSASLSSYTMPTYSPPSIPHYHIQLTAACCAISVVITGAGSCLPQLHGRIQSPGSSSALTHNSRRCRMSAQEEGVNTSPRNSALMPSEHEPLRLDCHPLTQHPACALKLSPQILPPTTAAMWNDFGQWRQEMFMENMERFTILRVILAQGPC